MTKLSLKNVVKFCHFMSVSNDQGVGKDLLQTAGNVFVVSMLNQECKRNAKYATCYIFYTIFFSFCRLQPLYSMCVFEGGDSKTKDPLGIGGLLYSHVDIQ